MHAQTKPASFDYDAYRNFRNASERGYSTLRGKYSRPGRAEKFLRKRLNDAVSDMGCVPGVICTFTVKAQKYVIWAVVLPHINGKTTPTFNVVAADEYQNYRFCDTEEEARHILAIRDLSDRGIRDLGHLKAKLI
jgi:hypothetical protein